MIYENLNDIADEFDVFLFDAYGVFWEGNGFYPNSRETMHGLIKKGKTVVVLSNTTQLREDAVQKYTERGLIEKRDYDFLITSGDLLQNVLQSGILEFQSLKKPHFYYVIGQPHQKAFENTIYEQTNQIEKADFAYCGVPFIYETDIEKYPQYKDQYLPAKADNQGRVLVWDSLTTAPFEHIVDCIAKRHIPILNANPDFTAREGHPLVAGRGSDFVVRNGAIAQMFRNKGAEVLEFGKPHCNIYDFAFTKLAEQQIIVNKARCCMIGDTVRTDIKGAVHSGIVPILCVDTGVTAEEISLGNSVEKLCQTENIDVQQVIQIKSVGGKK